LILLSNTALLCPLLRPTCLGIPTLRPKIELIVLPLNRPSFPIILLRGITFLRLVLFVENRQHLGLAIIDPLVEDKVGDFEVLSFVLKASHDDDLYEEGPVGYALDQLVLLPQIFVPLQDGLASLLQNISQTMALQNLAIQHVHDLLHVKFILLLTAHTPALGLGGRRLLEGQLLQLFLQLEVALLARVQHQHLEEEVQEVDDGIGVIEEVVLRQGSLGDSIGLATDPPPEIPKLEVAAAEHEVRDEYVKQLLLYLGIHEYFVRDVPDRRLPVDVAHEPPLGDQQVHRTQRDHVFTLKLTPAAHALLVSLLVAQLRQVFDKRNEYVLRVVLLELDLSRPQRPQRAVYPVLEEQLARKLALVRGILVATLFLG